jgi:hypothetical protein
MIDRATLQLQAAKECHCEWSEAISVGSAGVPAGAIRDRPARRPVTTDGLHSRGTRDHGKSTPLLTERLLDLPVILGLCAGGLQNNET